MRSLTAALVLAACTVTLAAPPDVPRIAPEEFALLPWGWSPGDADALREIRACGFNLAGFVAPDSVEAVAKAGLKCIVSDPSTSVSDEAAELPTEEIEKRVAAITGRFRNNAAVFGYYLRDEPTARPFPGIARWVAAFHAAAPKQLPYVNLFPNVASIPQLGVATYDEYVERFIETVKPRFVSYDHYALMDDGSLKDGYFQNLEAVRKLALEHELPFWNIVLGNGHFHYAEPTENGLRFQAYTTLAYGARGLSYFTYFTPAIGNYRLGAIDQFGHKTPTWDILRRTNLQIHRLAPTYVRLKSVNVFHHPQVPGDCRGMDTSRFVGHLAGGSLLVGEFEGPEARPYVLVVNKDLHRSTPFEIKFKTDAAIDLVSAYSGNVERWAGENNWLAPGQGMLLTPRK